MGAVSPVHEREPCPERIVDDAGGAFAMGAVGGSVFHFIKGLRNSLNGARIAGGVEAMRMNVPRVSGSFAVWGGLFSSFDCALVYVRQKEDPWNSITAGAATGGFLSMRRGLRSIVNSSLSGAAILALICGAEIMLNQTTVQQNIQPVADEDPTLATDEDTSSGSGWFGGLFGKRKLEEENASGSSNPEILETFDVPVIEIPSFDYK